MKKSKGNNPKNQYGLKKPSPSLIPPVAILEEAVVAGLGASKYGPYNWNDEPVCVSIYYDAIMRHLMAYYTGQDIDPESGVSHLAHIRMCCALLMDARGKGNLIDDRPNTSDAAQLIQTLTKK